MWVGRRPKLGFALVWWVLGGGALFAQSVFRQGGEFRVNNSTFNNQYEAAVAVDADGDFIITWTDAFKEGNRGIRVQDGDWLTARRWRSSACDRRFRRVRRVSPTAWRSRSERRRR